MLNELTSLIVTQFLSHLAELAFLFDLLLKSLLLVVIAKYYEKATSPFFSNSQKRNLWLTVLLLIGMLPIVALANHYMLNNVHAAPNLKLVTVLIPAEIVDMSISGKYYTTGIAKPLLTLYLVVLLIPLGRLVRSLKQIWLIHTKACFDTPPEVLKTLNRLRAELGIARAVRIATSDFHSSPMTYGTLRPTIVLPSSFFFDDKHLLENVLIHELGHIKRLDHITYIVCYLMAALNWFNPFVWICLKQLGLESEYACDNEVLRHRNRPTEFAGQLLSIARRGLEKQRHALACRAIITRGELSLRIDNILNNNIGLQQGKTHSSLFPGIMLFSLFVLTSSGKIFALGNERDYISEDLRLIYSEIPKYPESAILKGATGFVQFSFRVDEFGRIEPQSIVLRQSEPFLLFEESSLAALSSFVFAPRIVNGKRVATSNVQYTFEFEIRI